MKIKRFTALSLCMIVILFTMSCAFMKTSSEDSKSTAENRNSLSDSEASPAPDGVEAGRVDDWQNFFRQTFYRVLTERV